MSRSEALGILVTKESNLKLSSDYYKAIYHLSKFPGEDTNKALISLLRSNSGNQSILIAKRKAVEVLALHKCYEAIPLIYSLLASDDIYLQENAILALEKLEFRDPIFEEKLCSLLHTNNLNRRIVIKALASIGSKPCLQNITGVIANPHSKPIDKGAAIAATYALTGKSDHLFELEDNLFSLNQNERHCAVQDIIDAKLIAFIPCLLKSPIAPSFKIRAINLLWPGEELLIDQIAIIEILDSIIIDDFNNIKVVHEYEDQPKISFLLDELFSPDFSRCYLAMKAISSRKSLEIAPHLKNKFSLLEKDYGALYFANKLFITFNDWSQSILDKIENTALNCLDTKWPDQMKFKPAAIMTLIKFFPIKYKSKFTEWLDPRKTSYWVTRYALLMSIDSNYQRLPKKYISKLLDMGKIDINRFVRMKSESLSRKICLE